MAGRRRVGAGGALAALLVLGWVAEQRVTLAQVSVSATFDHFTTAFPLHGAHAFTTCDSCHVDAQFAGTPTQCVDCHAQGSRVQATFKHARHGLTTDFCEACHSPHAWVPVARVDHAEALDTCQGCHNDARFGGKPPGHVPAGDQCDDCHRTFAWSPAVFEHAGITSGCAACHDGTTAIGKPLGHIPATDTCEDCHGTSMFAPVLRVDHLQVVGVCSSCHNGTIAPGQHAGHIPTVAECDSCHGTAAWRP
jgi:hypothetical protein